MKYNDEQLQRLFRPLATQPSSIDPKRAKARFLEATREDDPEEIASAVGRLLNDAQGDFEKAGQEAMQRMFMYRLKGEGYGPVFWNAVCQELLRLYRATLP